MKFIPRDPPPRTVWALEQSGMHPLMARLYAARGVQSPDDIDDHLARLLPPEQLQGARAAAELLAEALRQQAPICIVADYDCDGATACAVALRGLRMLGGQALHYLVPDRVLDGYGLTPSIAERVRQLGARVLVTVDNGIASIEGVQAARQAGMQVLITDHHLPGATLPEAEVIVNPNQPGCTFPSKALAGVGVMFYVLLALRALLRERGAFEGREQPRLDALLPLVALGTVADVARLDANNRRLVSQGLKRIRKGQMPAGMAALLQVAGREAARVSSFDLGFALGPRINAAGRLADMTLGIECLLTDDRARALELAQALDAINRQRRDIEGDMRDQALALAESMFEEGEVPPPALCVFDPDFHEGVVGIVASRLKDKLHRPTFVFAPSTAPGKEHELKGSGRSIAGFHLRDALDLVSKRVPGAVLRFGGHAMAAGCTIHEDHLDDFEQALQAVAEEWLDDATLQRRLETDGPLPPEYRRLDVVDLLGEGVWGQGFAAPVFDDEVEVLTQRRVGERHLSLKLRHQGEPVEAMWFGRTEPLPARARLAYRLVADEWQGQRKLRFMIEAMQE